MMSLREVSIVGKLTKSINLIKTMGIGWFIFDSVSLKVLKKLRYFVKSLNLKCSKLSTPSSPNFGSFKW